MKIMTCFEDFASSLGAFDDIQTFSHDAVSRLAAIIFSGRPVTEGLLESIGWNAAFGALTGGIATWLGTKFSLFKMRGFLPTTQLKRVLMYTGPNTWKFVKQQVFQNSVGGFIPRYPNEQVEKAYVLSVTELTGWI